MQNWLVYLVMVLLAGGVARWFFRSVRQEVARRNVPRTWGTAVLPWLRAILAGLLVLGFAKPVYTKKAPVTQPGQVAVVLDTESGIAIAPPETQPEQQLRLMRNLGLIGDQDAALKSAILAEEFTIAINAMKGAADGEKRKKRLAQWGEFVERQERESKVKEAGRLPADWRELVQAKLVKPSKELGKKPSEEGIKTVLEGAGELRQQLRAHAATAAPAQMSAPAVVAASAKLQEMPGWERLRKLMGDQGLLNEMSQTNQVTLYLWHQGQLYRWWDGSPASAPKLDWPPLPPPVLSGGLPMEDFNADFGGGARRTMVLFSALGSDSAAPGTLMAGFQPGAYEVFVVPVGKAAPDSRLHLREIASQSSGQIIPEAETDRLPALLAGLARQKTERQTLFFFHHPALWLLAVTLFLTELFLRKRHGLL